MKALEGEEGVVVVEVDMVIGLEWVAVGLGWELRSVV